MAKKAVSPVVTINVIYNVGMLQCYNITMYASHTPTLCRGTAGHPEHQPMGLNGEDEVNALG